MKKASLLLSLLLLAGCTNVGTSNGGSGSSKSVAVKDAVDAAYATVLEENKVASMEMDKDTVISYFSLDDAPQLGRAVEVDSDPTETLTENNQCSTTGKTAVSWRCVSAQPCAI